MKNSWLLKILILSTVLATLSGCPALSNFMEMISREQNKPKKTIEITGIPLEYEGSLIYIMATDSTDTLGERLCMSGGMDNRVVKDGSGKTSILEMNSQKANSQMSVLIATAKNVTGTAKSCDDRERIVIFNLLLSDSYDGENQNVDSLMGKILNDTFIYTKGVNICNASADVLSNTKLTYSLSEMETTLKFSDFMRASDCETLMEIVSSTSKASKEYIVIKEDTLIVRDSPILVGKEVYKFTSGSIINVSLPKQTKEADGYLWTKIYYKDKNESKMGWVTELALVKTQETIKKTSALAGISKVSESHTEKSSTSPTIAEYIVIEKELDVMKLPYGGEVIGKIAQGETIKLSNGASSLSTGQFNWAEVSYGENYGETGWIIRSQLGKVYIYEQMCSQNLNNINSNFKEYFVIIKQSKTQRTNSEGTLKIRSEPKIDSEIIVQLNAGDIINVNENYACKNGNYLWIITNYGDKKGWVVKGEYNGSEFEEWIHPNVPIETSFKDYPNQLLLKESTDEQGNKTIVVEPISSSSSNENTLYAKRVIFGKGEYSDGEVEQDTEYRYHVAVGPKILHKNYPNSGTCQHDEFSGFSRYIEVVLRNIKTKKEIEFEGIVMDIKAHTYNYYPDDHKDGTSYVRNAEFYGVAGIMQTGIRYPDCVNGLSVAYDLTNEKGEIYHNMDGSVIEFLGGSFNKDYGKLKNINNINSDYEVVKVTSNIHRDKKCFFYKDVSECSAK